MAAADILRIPSLDEDVVRDGLAAATDDISINGQDLVDVTNIAATGAITVGSTATIAGATSTVGLTDSSALFLTGVASPAALAGAVNNFNLTASTFVLRLDGGAASRNITGIDNGAAGRTIIIVNIGASDNLVLVNASASSDAENRFAFAGAANLTLTPGASARLWYDGTSTVWRNI